MKWYSCCAVFLIALAILFGVALSARAADPQEVRVTIEKRRAGLLERLRDAREARPRPLMVTGADAKRLTQPPARTASSSPDRLPEPVPFFRIIVVKE